LSPIFEYATLGCTRTTDEAMKKIMETAKTDALTKLNVENNRKKPEEAK
jgi:hypothetical protein